MGEVVKISSGFTGDAKLNQGKYRLTRIETISTGEVDEQRVGYSNENVPEKYRLLKGDILYSNINSLSHIGKVALVKDDMELYHGINLLRLSLKKDTSSQFLFQLLGTDLHRHWAKVHANQAVSQASINQTELSKQLLVLPTHPEQARIGSFFRQLDDLLTLHQRKLEETKALKKSLLQKMFPKKGEKIPEFRLPGFEGEWEEKKLEDVYQNISNAFVGTATPYYVEDGHFYLESNNIKDGQINYNNKVFINDEFYEKQKDKWLQTGDMVMVQSGHVGHTAVIPEELNNTAAHALIMFRKPKFDIEPYFLNFQYQTHKLRKKIDTITTGNTIRHILASDMKRFVVDITSYDEQIAIGNFFKRLDDLIMLHDKKLRDLRLLKKALLQQMFV